MKYLLIALLSFLAFSCIPHKKLLYLKPDSPKQVESFTIDTIYQYKIQPGDMLGIDITSTVASQIEIFNKKFENQEQGYIVNREGNIELPLVGVIKVNNLTTEEINAEIKKSLNTYIDYVTVTTKLISFRITVLGEVKVPGTFPVIKERINIYEALGMAGDLTDYGNRKKVKIIRKTLMGSDLIVINIQEKNILSSEYYYLRPDDIIYVEPLKPKALRVNSPTIQIAITGITLLFVILNFTRQL
jgi:polysaccharide export outer membrane protein